MTREDFDKMVLNRPGRSKLEREKFLAVGEACKAIFWPSLGFKRENFLLAVGSQQRGPQFLHSQ